MPDYSERYQVDRYAAAVRDQLGEEVADLAGGGFTDWEAALRFTVRIAAQQPLLVVLDEVPRLLAGRPDFADLLSAVWESRSAGSRILLALTGSAVSVMEHMLGPQGGLHRRASLDPRGSSGPLVLALQQRLNRNYPSYSHLVEDGRVRNSHRARRPGVPAPGRPSPSSDLPADHRRCARHHQYKRRAG